MKIDKRSKLILIIVAVQIIFFCGWYADETGVMGKPIKQIMLKTLPVDPRDLLSGQYMIMRYDFNTITNQNFFNGQEIWVSLSEQNGLYIFENAYSQKPNANQSNIVAIKGVKSGYDFASFGIEKFFIPEGTPEPRTEDMKVLLDVYKNGKVRINTVYVNDKKWP